MKWPRADRAEDGVTLRYLPPLLVQSLKELPELLADGQPGIDRRKGPPAYPTDADFEEEWQRLAAPELAHLFEASRETVAGDLENLHRERFALLGHRVFVPGDHVTAWLSALAAARVALGEVHGIAATDMDRPLPQVIASPRERAILLVHLLGWIQGLLCEAEDEEG